MYIRRVKMAKNMQNDCFIIKIMHAVISCSESTRMYYTLFCSAKYLVRAMYVVIKKCQKMAPFFLMQKSVPIEVEFLITVLDYHGKQFSNFFSRLKRPIETIVMFLMRDLLKGLLIYCFVA